MRKVVVVIVALVMILMAPTQVLAASNPYKDVTRKTVDSDSYNAISYVKSHKGFRDIAGTKFYPNRKVTRREFILILHNMYGDKMTCTMDDLRYASRTITSKFACDRMVALSKKLGYPIKWAGNSQTLRRKDVARYVKIFATFNKRLAPRK